MSTLPARKAKNPAPPQKRGNLDDDDEYQPKKKPRRGRPPKNVSTTTTRRTSLNTKSKDAHPKGDPKRRSSAPIASQYGRVEDPSELDIDDEIEVMPLPGSARKKETQMPVQDQLFKQVTWQDRVGNNPPATIGTPLDDGSGLESSTQSQEDVEADAEAEPTKEPDERGRQELGLGRGMKDIRDEHEDERNPTPTRQGSSSRRELTVQSGVIVVPSIDKESTQLCKFKQFMADKQADLTTDSTDDDSDDDTDSDSDDEEDSSGETAGQAEPKYSPHQKKIRDALADISDVPPPPPLPNPACPRLIAR
jgi:hypothetical protein